MPSLMMTRTAFKPPDYSLALTSRDAIAITMTDAANDNYKPDRAIDLCIERGWILEEDRSWLEAVLESIEGDRVLIRSITHLRKPC